MKTLRTLHLYLGCLFAPMLVFFGVSGVWQTLHLHYTKNWQHPQLLALISTIHTSSGFKGAEPTTLSSRYMEWFVIAMSAGLILTIVLGVLMAFKFGKRGPAWFCLIAGILIPVVLVLLTLHRKGCF